MHNILILDNDPRTLRFLLEYFYEDEISIADTSKLAIEYVSDFDFNLIFINNEFEDDNNFLSYLSNHIINSRLLIIFYSNDLDSFLEFKPQLENMVFAPYGTDIFLDFVFDIN